MPREDVQKFGKKYTDELGLGRNFFHNLKRTNPECLDYIISKDPSNIVNAFRLYEEEKYEVTQESCRIYYDLEDKYLLHDFGRYLVYKGLYGSVLTYFYIYKTIFRPEGKVKTFKAFMQIKKSNEYYKEFISKMK